MIFFIFNSLLGLFIVPLFINNMGTELYGIWVLNFAIMNYFIFLNSSISGGIVKNISESLNTQDITKQITTINVSLVFYLLIGFTIWIVFTIGVDFIVSFFKVKAVHYQTLKHLLLISASFAIIIWPLKVFEAVFSGLLRSITLNIARGSIATISSLAIIILLKYHLRLEILIIVFYSLNMMTGIILFCIYYKKYPQYRFKLIDFNKDAVKPILGFSLNLMVLEIIATLSFQVDTFVIAYFLPVYYIAVYAVVTKFFYLLQGVYGTLLGVIQPMIFQAYHNGDKEFMLKMALKGFKYILIFYVPLILIASVISKPFIILWLGEEFGRYAIWSSVFLLQYLISPAIGVLGTISIGMNKLKYMQLYGAFAAFSNLGLSIWMVQLYGFQGVILGTVITTFFGVMIVYPYYCKAIDLDWKLPIQENYREFISLIAFLIAGFICIDLIDKFSWFLLLSVATLYFFIIYLWMFVFFAYPEDKKKLLKIINRSRINR